MICLVQSCFSLLPGLMGFVYADCSFAEFSLFFFSCFLFSLGPGQSPEYPTSPCGHFQQGIVKGPRVSWEQAMLLLFLTTL